MKLFDIALKDMLQSFRSFFAIAFMFGVPILVTLLFFVMFRGFGGGEEEGFNLPRTSVLIVNLDQGELPADARPEFEMPGDSRFDFSDVDSVGNLLTQLLQLDVFSDLMDVSVAADANSARTAVDNQEAGLAIIIPADFTDAVTMPEVSTSVEFYQDPTLTIGPAIVQGIMSQLLDTFSAATIGTNVTLEGLAESGVAIDPALIQEIVSLFSAATTGASQQGSPDSGLIEVVAPAGANASSDFMSEIIGTILAGMLVFFAFLTASGGIESILTEEERGTLARLFTTPTSHRTIFAGKSLAALLTVAVQVAVLLIFGMLVFNIDWGDPLPVILAGVGIVIITTSAGLFLVSFLKDTRQTGIVFGGVLTLTGMIGMIPVFTAGVPNQPEAVGIVSLLVPQGWAIRGLLTAMDGGSVSDMLLTLAVILLWSLVFAAIGQYRMQRRFA